MTNNKSPKFLNNLIHKYKAFDNQQIVVYGILTAFSFMLMLFCTKSSPLFAFNDWYDANVYFTMGKGFVNGCVPYVDLIDNKGSLLYLIYGIAWMLDKTGFWGIFLFQSLFVAVSVIFIYRLAWLFVQNKQGAFFVALCSPMPMLLNRFYAAGYDFGVGGPDEICRALMIVALFYFTLYYVKPEEYKPHHTLILGCLFMGVFLIKFNLIVFWVGFLLAIACELIYKKKFAFLLKHIMAFVSGAFVTALPYLIYGAVTGSLGAFMNTYFFLQLALRQPQQQSHSESYRVFNLCRRSNWKYVGYFVAVFGRRGVCVFRVQNWIQNRLLTFIVSAFHSDILHNNQVRHDTHSLWNCQ